MERTEHFLIIGAEIAAGLLLLIGIVRVCTVNPDMRADREVTDVGDGFFEDNWFGIILSLLFKIFFWGWWF